MPELVRRQPIRFSLVKQVRRELLPKHMAEHISTESASCVAEEVVFFIVIGKCLRSLLLPLDRCDRAITLAGGNAVITSRFREPMLNRDPPIALAILDQTAASAMSIGGFQMSQIFKAHPRPAQDEECIPVHRQENLWFLPCLQRTDCLFQQDIELLKDIGRKWPRRCHWRFRQIFHPDQVTRGSRSLPGR